MPTPSQERSRLIRQTTKVMVAMGFDVATANGGTSYARYVRGDVRLTVHMHDHRQPNHGVEVIREGTCGARRAAVAAATLRAELASAVGQVVA